LPVIVSENVGAKDVVENGVNGFVVSDAAAAAVTELADTNRRETMGAAAAQTAARHDWAELARGMDAIYQEILAR
jgi:glycosyltransferase involved in cell wall biosynthesis